MRCANDIFFRISVFGLYWKWTHWALVRTFQKQKTFVLILIKFQNETTCILLDGSLTNFKPSTYIYIVECIKEIVIMHFMGKVDDQHDIGQNQWDFITLKCAKLEKSLSIFHFCWQYSNEALSECKNFNTMQLKCTGHITTSNIQHPDLSLHHFTHTNNLAKPKRVSKYANCAIGPRIFWAYNFKIGF